MGLTMFLRESMGTYLWLQKKVTMNIEAFDAIIDHYIFDF